MKKIIFNFFLTICLIIQIIPVNAAEKYTYFTNCFVLESLKENYPEYEGYIIPDYANATQTIHENGDVEGTIPLIIVDTSTGRNITLPDGSQYRYSYMASSHCWWYDFKLINGFGSYSGYVVLTKYQSASATPVSVYAYGKSNTIELPYNTKLSGYLLNQTGSPIDAKGKKYFIPALNISV